MSDISAYSITPGVVDSIFLITPKMHPGDSRPLKHARTHVYTYCINYICQSISDSTTDLTYALT